MIIIEFFEINFHTQKRCKNSFLNTTLPQPQEKQQNSGKNKKILHQI